MTKIISRVHITPHMHWDREWYFTTEESRILLVNNMDEILLRLESDQDYQHYVLDGQTAILEDYFAIKPQNKARVNALVKASRLIIGPWYTQTDTLMVSGESIARNLLYGMRDSRALGEPMLIGYLPDSFGMSAQLPHIFNQFGITRVMFWRGCSERHGTDKTEFFWCSKDGSRVVVQVLPLGYAIGKYLPNDKKQLSKRLNSYFSILDKGSITKEILLPNGHDQMPLQQDIFEVVETLRDLYPQRQFLFNRYETVFEKIEQQSNCLATIEGEFNDGKYMRVHRTISSTRMDIKIANAQIENKIINLLEPLASIAWTLGFEYHHGLFEKMWKEVLKNHAHDSIACCCSDKVNQEIKNRFILADDMAENLLRFYMRKIVDSMPNQDGRDKLVLFNLSPYARQEVINTRLRTRATSFKLIDNQGHSVPYYIRDINEIDSGLIDRQIVHYGDYQPFLEYEVQLNYVIPAMGFIALWIEPEQSDNVIAVNHDDRTYLENEFYHLTINKNGTLKIYDKQTEQTYDQVLQIEEGSDDGDEYDYSPAKDEWLTYSSDCDSNIQIKHEGYQSIATIKLSMAVPKNLTQRKEKQCGGRVDFLWKITLAQGSKRIDCELKVDNQADDHRVRVLIPTPYPSKMVITDNQFGTITRSVEDSAMQQWLKENWQEAPVPIWRLINFAVLQQNQMGMAIFSEGLRELEITGKQHNTFALTLFRSIGVLGKEELSLRPGRPSGIKLATPDSQMRGKLHCRFALMSFTGDYISANIAQLARDYLTPIQCYNKIPHDAMKLNPSSITIPATFSLLSKNISGLVLSTLKKAEDLNGLILRLYNPSQTNVVAKDRIIFSQPIKVWQETNMDEQRMDSEQSEVGEIIESQCCQSRSFLLY